MIIVSDTSPINNLAAINQLHLLHQLYGTVLIPKAVYRELTVPNFPVAGATKVQTFEWLQTLTVSNRTLFEALSNELDIGEAEAIALAVEIQADQVLIDERRGKAFIRCVDQGSRILGCRTFVQQRFATC